MVSLTCMCTISNCSHNSGNRAAIILKYEHTIISRQLFADNLCIRFSTYEKGRKIMHHLVVTWNICTFFLYCYFVMYSYLVQLKKASVKDNIIIWCCSHVLQPYLKVLPISRTQNISPGVHAHNSEEYFFLK